MNYLKPELLDRYRSLDDDMAEAATVEWEEALAAYRSRLRSIRWRLPRAVRRLRAHYSLHDGLIVALTFGRRTPRLTMLLRLEDTPSQPGPVLEMSYLLVAGRHGGVTFKKNQLKKDGQDRWFILYDEFDMDEERAFFTHSILLANGNEIAIRFQHLQLRLLEQVLVSPGEFAESEKTWPLVEA